MHGGAVRCFSLLRQFRANFDKDSAGELVVGNAQEFGCAPVDPADAGEQAAHGMVDDAFHWG